MQVRTLESGREAGHRGVRLYERVTAPSQRLPLDEPELAGQRLARRLPDPRPSGIRTDVPARDVPVSTQQQEVLDTSADDPEGATVARRLLLDLDRSEEHTSELQS